MTTQPERHTMRSSRLAAWCLWGPTLLAALAVCGVEGLRARRPDDALFATPFAYSLADAIEHDDVQRAYAFIRAGQDPNGVIAVRHADKTAGRTVLVSPLLWAVDVRAEHAVWMLLGFGARLDAESSRTAICLATQLGYTDIANAIGQYGATPASRACRTLRAGEVPLLAALEESRGK